jgi:Rps23 Pro-64 3,4-dihydroxylase Tpa1-like proline 4-hydroxylase
MGRPGGDDLYLDEVELTAVGKSLYAQYSSAAPFPHAVLDDFLPASVLEKVLAEFPSARAPGAVFYDQGYVGGKAKAQYHPQTLSSAYIRSFFHVLNSQPFLGFLEGLTGITGLLSDPYFDGGGLHEIWTGGKLGIHADFRIQRRCALHRRLNVLIYLNKDWDTTWGGELELWDSQMKRCVRSIAPLFNRCVVFNTDERSFHGHPEALRTPAQVSRKSIALYYYTASKAVYDEIPNRSTDYRLRPGESASNVAAKIMRSVNLAAEELMPPVLKRIPRALRNILRR